MNLYENYIFEYIRDFAVSRIKNLHMHKGETRLRIQDLVNHSEIENSRNKIDAKISKFTAFFLACNLLQLLE